MNIGIKKRNGLLWIMGILIWLTSGRSIWAQKPLERPEVQQFIAEMVEQHQFDESYLKKIFAQIDFQPEIIAAMMKPAEGLPWYRYRTIFLKPERIAGGVKFWAQHEKTLARATQQYGVPPEMILAIIGVETFYGKNMGKHLVFESLTTLAFDYPKRAAFFRGELIQYLLLCREQGFDVLAIKGSYAGAVGYAQFISSSYRRLAVDFNQDGKIDLWDAEDAIGSIAHYFKEHGWQAGKPVVAQVSLAPHTDPSELLAGGIKPTQTIGELRQAGVIMPKKWRDEALGKLLAFELDQGSEYWLGFNNFYTISRYNHSQLYSLAAYQLGQKIKAEWQQQHQPKTPKKT